LAAPAGILLFQRVLSDIRADRLDAAAKQLDEAGTDAGFDPVDAGPLRMARYLEPFTMLIAQLAYEGDGGPELAYRFERFGRGG
jgi:predicted dinucleotide-binding enzyme